MAGRSRRNAIVLTCEHGGNRVPARYASLFDGYEKLLASHRGYDPGALELARRMARHLRCPLHAATISRLFVELNRSIGHRALFSQISRRFDREQRQAVLDRYYHPHRNAVEERVRTMLSKGGIVIQLGIHSFTPVLQGEVRRTDIGLLYDPARPRDVAFCLAWQATLQAHCPTLRIRRNYPYRGNSNGLCTALRRKLRNERYIGISIEVNQRFPRAGGSAWTQLQRQIIASICDVLGRRSNSVAL